MIESILNVFAVSMLFIVLGDIIVERSGVVNLSIDGVITLAIATSYVATLSLGHIYALITTLLLIIVTALMVSIFINILHASHILTGLSMNITLYGLSATMGIALGGGKAIKQITLPLSYLALCSILATIIVWHLLYRTRLGTMIRACGFNPRASEALGVKIWRVRMVALSIGYSLIAIGSYMYTAMYRGAWLPYSGMGYGFLALALAMASSWHPLLALPITLLFVYFYTSIYALQLFYGVPAAVVNMLPFVVSVTIVTILQVTPIRKKLPIPRSLGEVYFKEERAA